MSKLGVPDRARFKTECITELESDAPFTVVIPAHILAREVYGDVVLVDEASVTLARLTGWAAALWRELLTGDRSSVSHTLTQLLGEGDLHGLNHRAAVLIADLALGGWIELRRCSQKAGAARRD